jgi:hypothetical protein
LTDTKVKADSKNPEEQAEKIVAAIDKANKAKVKSAKSSAPKTPRVTIDNVTVEYLQQGITLKTLVTKLMKRFPGRDEDVLTHTTKRRLHGYLQQKLGVKIVKSDSGVYKIQAKKAKKAKESKDDKKTPESSVSTKTSKTDTKNPDSAPKSKS